MQNGTLYIISTPIGNLNDITLRALETLRSVDIIICEDTRVSRVLLKHFAIDKRLISYNNNNERGKTPVIIELLLSGKNIGLISDAGTPLISDPGFILLREVQNKGIKVEGIGGICSIILALTLSGLPSNQFIFLGFLERTSNKRCEIFRKYRADNLTIIFFESPKRIKNTLQDIMDVFGKDVEIVIARELTKMYEEIKREKIENLIDLYNTKPPKGEIVVLLRSCSDNISLESLDAHIEDFFSKDKNKNISTKHMAKIIASELGVKKNVVYEKIIQYKNNVCKG